MYIGLTCTPRSSSLSPSLPDTHKHTIRFKSYFRSRTHALSDLNSISGVEHDHAILQKRGCIDILAAYFCQIDVLFEP